MAAEVLDSLGGKKEIGDLVNCISPENMVKFHSVYELKEKDYKDVLAICQKFTLELLEEYLKFFK